MRKDHKTYLIQFTLFVITVFTTTWAGVEWMGLAGSDYNMESFINGLLFSIPFLGILTVHEFGHYITARLYKVKVSLPYYIPFYIPLMHTIGTMGAFIRIKSPHKSKREVFDIGVAGPLAGFVAALGVLYYGYTHLPEPEHIYNIHPEYKAYGLSYEEHVYNYEFSKKLDSMRISEIKKIKPDYREDWPKKEYITLYMDKNLLLLFFEKYVADNPEWIPNEYELFHNPFIFAGLLALFFTALNLLPIGQLDGGHIIFGMFGTRGHKYISLTAFIALVYFAGIGVFRNNLFGNVFGSLENLLSFGPIYLYLLFFIFGKISDNWKNNLMIASCIFAGQYFTEFFFPEFRGIGLVYLVFAGVIGRFLGVHHPPAYIEEPLDWKRKIIGWVSLIIFVLCFTPHLLVQEIFRP